jgi:hypothetical protein
VIASYSGPIFNIQGVLNDIYFNIITTFQVLHKLNYFSNFQNFWILIVSYDENLKDSCYQPNLILEPLLRVAYNNNLLTT